MSKSPQAVIDQPGLKIIVTGIIAAVFLGLSIKSQITEIKVTRMVKKAIDSHGHNLEVDFEKAEVKLSDWGIPKPYVVINQLRIKNVVSPCADNQIYIERLIVPVSLSLVFDPSQIMTSLSLNRVEIRIGSQDRCVDSAIKPSTKLSTSQENLLTARGEPSEKSVQEAELEQEQVKFLLLDWRNKFSTRLDEVRIDFIKIIQENDFSKNLELRNASLQFEYQNKLLEKIIFQAQLVGLFDSHTANFKLRSQIFSELVFTDTRSVGQLALKGKIIDRDFTAEAQFDSDTGLVKTVSHLKSIPLKTLHEIFSQSTSIDKRRFESNKDKIEKPDYQISLRSLLNFNISGEYTSEYDVYRKKWRAMFVSNAVIKSADSSIELNYFDYLKWITDEKYKIQLVVVQLDLNHFNQFFGLGEEKNVFDHLGFFSGTFEVAKNYESNLTGILRDTAIIFSSQNKKRTQKITSMNIKSVVNKNLFQLKLSDISIENQKVAGQIELKLPYQLFEDKLDLEPRFLQINVNLKGQLLTPEIEKHMLGHVQDSDLLIKYAVIGASRQVIITTDELKFESLTLKKMSFVTELDSNFKPFMYKLTARNIALVESENEDAMNNYLRMMQSYFIDQKVQWPLVAQNFDVKYYIGSRHGETHSRSLPQAEDPYFDSFSLHMNSFLLPKNLTQFRQSGRLSQTSVWHIENTLKAIDLPAMSSHFILDPAQSSFKKVE